MSKQWYCPQCGPVDDDMVAESINLPRHLEAPRARCMGCFGLMVSPDIPPFVISMQEQIAELEKAANPAPHIAAFTGHAARMMQEGRIVNHEDLKKYSLSFCKENGWVEEA